VTEDDLLASIREIVSVDDPRVALGVGDDAAVLDGGVVVSVDAQVEGSHFRRGWLSLEDVGWRGTVAALSDLAAMGATAEAVISSVVIAEASDALGVMRGAAQAAHAHGAVVVGGNVARGDTLSLHTTVIGRARTPWTRSGARVGDAVYVTGPLGSAALGWRLLERGDDGGPFVERWRRPRARFDLRGAIAPTACIDLSDGLALDLGRLCRAGAVGAVLEEAAIPTEPGLAAAAAAIGEDAAALSLGGGEDYELAFTMPASLDPAIAVRVGEVVEGAGVRIRARDGTLRDAVGGHQHF